MALNIKGIWSALEATFISKIEHRGESRPVDSVSPISKSMEKDQEVVEEVKKKKSIPIKKLLDIITRK